ncbi:hypothetical protein SNOG_08058 [Parastagonospora nodorum SN15]|uniref:Uncharacterized protein n=1 Tax=Phaeosphaeria nodorum (strain SN15 / ATCC MYA-4574 / FGSC 10173) TaxID=321614 RepID=Q0UJK6_PHANO|nr:hypothetical protein SNOG_08058 [Parastagonospora nodorum SN15]EAT84334.1 hypothetical protein SNOG_08058 [Parastagonospora nodorum SN15]
MSDIVKAMQFNIIFIAIGLLTATSSARRTKTSYTATAAVIMTRHVCADLQTALESELLVTYRPTVKVPDETKSFSGYMTPGAHAMLMSCFPKSLVLVRASTCSA